MAKEGQATTFGVVVIRDHESQSPRKWSAITLERCMVASSESVIEALSNWEL